MQFKPVVIERTMKIQIGSVRHDRLRSGRYNGWNRSQNRAIERVLFFAGQQFF